MDLVIHVWELDPRTGERMNAKPEVTHVFRGATRDECEELLDAHAESDAFLGAAMNSGMFEGIGLAWRGVLVDAKGKEYAWQG